MAVKKGGKLLKMVLTEGVARVVEQVPRGCRTRYVERLVAEDFKRGAQALFRKIIAEESELRTLAAPPETPPTARELRQAPGNDPKGRARLPNETLHEYMERTDKLRLRG